MTIQVSTLSIRQMAARDAAWVNPVLTVIAELTAAVQELDRRLAALEERDA